MWESRRRRKTILLCSPEDVAWPAPANRLLCAGFRVLPGPWEALDTSGYSSLGCWLPPLCTSPILPNPGCSKQRPESSSAVWSECRPALGSSESSFQSQGWGFCWRLQACYFLLGSQRQDHTSSPSFAFKCLQFSRFFWMNISNSLAFPVGSWP